jgi:hypothetical protein
MLIYMGSATLDRLLFRSLVDLQCWAWKLRCPTCSPSWWSTGSTSSTFTSPRSSHRSLYFKIIQYKIHNKHTKLSGNLQYSAICFYLQNFSLEGLPYFFSVAIYCFEGKCNPWLPGEINVSKKFFVDHSVTLYNSAFPVRNHQFKILLAPHPLKKILVRYQGSLIGKCCRLIADGEVNPITD